MQRISLENLSISHRLTVVVSLMCLAMAIIGAIGLYGMQSSQNTIGKVYQEGMQASKLAGEIRAQLSENFSHLMRGLQHDPGNPVSSLHDHPLSNHLNGMTESAARITEAAKKLDAIAFSNPEIQAKLQTFNAARNKLGMDGLLPAKQTLQAEMYADAAEFVPAISPLYLDAARQSDQLVALLEKESQVQMAAVASRAEMLRNIAITAIALSILLGVWLSRQAIRAVVRPLDQLMHHLSHIAKGRFDNEIVIERHDELGKALDSLKQMQEELGQNVETARKLADVNLRIRIALDNVNSAVTVSDENNVLIYMNHTANRLFDVLAANHGGAKSLIGGKLSSFLEDGEFKTAFTAQLTQPRKIEGTISGRKMQVEPCPVRDDNDVYVGRVTQWHDRTDEAAVELEIEDMVQAASQGDFSHRIDVNGKSGFFKTLTEGINQFVNETEIGLNEIARMLEAMAAGDLSSRMEGHYRGTFGQLKDNANATMDQLGDIVNSIRDAAQTINMSSNKIASGNSDLSGRTESQAASIEETAASMEELTSTVKHNAHNALEASELAHSATEVAMQGGAVVGQVVDTMGEIAGSSKKIADIISIIDSIAFQTNILALNAAVEAARAGEQGRGFAVVAGEVRNLAQRSSQAAKEIKDLIQDSTAKVANGHKLVSEAGETMEQVVASIQKVYNIMSEISSASAEQSQGIEQVNVALAQMDEATQQNAALVEEAASAARTMEDQASSLVNAVGFFQVGVQTDLGNTTQPAKLAHLKTPKIESWNPERAAPRRPAPRLAAAANGTAEQSGDWAVF